MFYISSKRGSKYGIRDTKDGIEEFYSPDQIKQIAKKIKIYGVSYKGITVVTYTMFRNFEDLADYFLRYMKREGIFMGYSSEQRIEDCNGTKCFSSRFVMGESAWYCSFETGDDEDGYCEDICDADTMKREPAKKLRAACMKFYADTGIYPSCQTGEKAWCYFEFM